MARLVIKVKKLHPEAQLPKFAQQGDAGADLFAIEGGRIGVGGTKIVKTGIAIGLPEGYEAQVRCRSGLAIKRGVEVLNAPGTVDSCYRGEVGVVIHNTKRDEDFVYHAGDRIAQLIVKPVPPVVYEEVEDLDETGRGAGGFGSTGK